MFERYTEEARRAVYYSRAEALVRKASAICVPDVLVGIARDKNSRASQIASLKPRDAELRAALGIAPFPENIDCSLPGPKNAIPLDSDVKKTLAYAAQEADADHEFWLDTDHLLRGLLRFPNAATDVLAKLGIELEAMRAASIRNRQEFPPQRVRNRLRLRAFVKKFRAHLILIAILLIIFAYLKSQG